MSPAVQPSQTPPKHRSHRVLLKQDVPSGAPSSGGHTGFTPSQFSAAAQSPKRAGRQTVLEGATALAGHVTLPPVHRSSTSQLAAPPAPELAARHTTLGPANASSGQRALMPLHISRRSQSPALSRQTPVRKVSTGHVMPPPHTSAMSHGPAAGRHSVLGAAAPLGMQEGILPEQAIVPKAHGFPGTSQLPPGVHPLLHTPSASQNPPGQVRPTGARSSAPQASAPPHVSSTSQGPAAGRQTKVGLA